MEFLGSDLQRDWRLQARRVLAPVLGCSHLAGPARVGVGAAQLGRGVQDPAGRIDPGRVIALPAVELDLCRNEFT